MLTDNYKFNGRRHPDTGNSRDTLFLDRLGMTGPEESYTHSLAEEQEGFSTFLSMFDPPKVLQARSLPYLLANIIDEAVRFTGAKRGTIFLADHKRGVLTNYLGHGLSIKEITLPIGSGIAGHVAIHGRIYKCEDAYRSPFFDRSSDERTGYRTRAVLSAPIKNQDGTTIGVIELLNKSPSFNSEDEPFIKAYASHVAVSIENALLYKERERTFKSSIEAIASTIDKKDPATAGHSSRVCRLSLLMARELELTDVEGVIIEYAGLLHDIGKIGIRDKVLLKPGRLDDTEYAQIKRHAIYTGDILHKMHWPEEWKDIPLIAAMHHERLDGSGYPNRCKAGRIPLPARILELVDAYDALTAVDRPYRRALSHEKVIELLGRETTRGLHDTEIYLTLKHMDLSKLRSVYGDKVYSEKD